MIIIFQLSYQGYHLLPPFYLWNKIIQYAFDDISKFHCISMAFDGLANETNFIQIECISFINESTNNAGTRDCHHAAKNMR